MLEMKIVHLLGLWKENQLNKSLLFLVCCNEYGDGFMYVYIYIYLYLNLYQFSVKVISSKYPKRNGDGESLNILTQGCKANEG